MKINKFLIQTLFLTWIGWLGIIFMLSLVGILVGAIGAIWSFSYHNFLWIKILGTSLVIWAICIGITEYLQQLEKKGKLNL